AHRAHRWRYRRRCGNSRPPSEYRVAGRDSGQQWTHGRTRAEAASAAPIVSETAAAVRSETLLVDTGCGRAVAWLRRPDCGCIKNGRFRSVDAVRPSTDAGVFGNGLGQAMV